jgi:hypothetical protein
MSPHFPHRLLQHQDLLVVMVLRFLDFVDDSSQTLKLCVLLRPHPPIRLSKLAKLSILPRQPPLQVCNRRLKSNDLDVSVLQNEFPNLSADLNELELEFPTLRLKVSCAFHPVFHRRPSIAARNGRNCSSKACERIL